MFVNYYNLYIVCFAVKSRSCVFWDLVRMVGGPVMSVNDVLEAIDALYLNSDLSVKEQASNWLCEFQKSVSI